MTISETRDGIQTEEDCSGTLNSFFLWDLNVQTQNEVTQHKLLGGTVTLTLQVKSQT